MRTKNRYWLSLTLLVMFLYTPKTAMCESAMVVTPAVKKSNQDEVTANFCRAELILSSPGDMIRLVKGSDNVNRVQIGLGSENFGAIYAATLCIVTASEGQSVKNTRLSFVLTDTALGGNDSYTAAAGLKLHATLACEDKTVVLYSGSFINQSASMTWSQSSGKACSLTMQWSETSNGERPRGLASTSVTGLLFEAAK